VFNFLNVVELFHSHPSHCNQHLLIRYEQVDACVATFPKPGNGPVDDPSLAARLKGLKWLATQGKSLPAGVERILVMDATDLKDLPITNGDAEKLGLGVKIEEFWKGEGRKPTRVLLRHGDNARAIAVAKAAAKAAAAAAEASEKAKAAIESGDAELAAEAALECQMAAMASNDFIQKEIEKTQVRHTVCSMILPLVSNLFVLHGKLHLLLFQGFQTTITQIWSPR